MLNALVIIGNRYKVIQDLKILKTVMKIVTAIIETPRQCLNLFQDPNELEEFLDDSDKYLEPFDLFDYITGTHFQKKSELLLFFKSRFASFQKNKR